MGIYSRNNLCKGATLNFAEDKISMPHRRCVMKPRLSIAVMLVVVLSLTATAQIASSNSPQPQPLTSSSQQEAAQPQSSLGVALLLPGGRSVAYAAPLPA